MSTTRAWAAIAAILGLFIGVLAPSSGAQDGGQPPPPPLAGTTTFVASGAFPALTFLQVEFAGGSKGTCSATLIDPSWVLTAAHCVESNGEPAVDVQMLIGGTDPFFEFNNPGTGMERHSAAGWILPGTFQNSSSGIFDDVALLRLATPSSITPMPLTTNAALVTPSNGNVLPARTIGYGQCGETRADCNDFRLRQGTAELRSPSDIDTGNGISGWNGANFPTEVFNKNLFAMPDVNVDGAICPGDSGGPLLVMDNGAWRVAGVNSFISLNGPSTTCIGTIDGGTRYLNAFANTTTTFMAGYVAQAVAGANITCWGAAVTMVGTSFSDKIMGSVGADVMHGRGGIDLLIGFQGNDRLCGGGARDVIFGGSGVDRIKGDGSADTLFGGNGADIIRGGAGNDTASGGKGNDTIEGQKGNDKLNGNGGKDVLKGNGGKDVLKGNGGNDTLKGGGGADKLKGNGGNDKLKGGPGSDTCDGGTGTNTFSSC